MQAVREPLRGERQQAGLQVVELAAQHQVAVDHEQDVRGGLVGKLPGRPAGPELLDRADTRSPEELLTTSQRGGRLRHDPAHDVRLLAVVDRADVRQARQHRQPAAAEVEDVHPTSAGLWVSARASSTVRNAPDLPDRGPPTTAR